MKTEKKIEIDGVKYTFFQRPARDSLRLLTKILKLIGAPLSSTLSESESKKTASMLDINIGVIVKELCNNLSEDEVMDIIDLLLSEVHHNGSKELNAAGKINSSNFDVLFSGELKHLFKVIQKALEVEYSDFFGGNLDFQSLLKTKKVEGTTQKTSI